MDLIKNLLLKYQDSLKKGELVREKIYKVLEEDFKWEIKKEDLEVKPPVLKIKNLSSSLKSEVFIQQQKILTKLSDIFGENFIKEIK